MTRLRQALATERARAGFSASLVDTLDIADSEVEVRAVARRAAADAFPEARFQLLLADNSMAEIEPAMAGVPVLCNPGTPQGCPAIRKGKTVVNSPGTRSLDVPPPRFGW